MKGFLSRLLEPLLKPRVPLMKNVLKHSAKSVFILLRLTAAASAPDAGINVGSRETLIFRKERRWPKKKEAKEPRGEFSMLLGALCVSLLGYLLTDKGLKVKIPGRGVIRASQRTIRAGQDF